MINISFTAMDVEEARRPPHLTCWMTNPLSGRVHPVGTPPPSNGASPGRVQAFWDTSSDIETVAREEIAEDGAFLADAYGFKDADIEELVAVRDR